MQPAWQVSFTLKCFYGQWLDTIITLQHQYEVIHRTFCSADGMD
jgi:hypothetical protein